MKRNLILIIAFIVMVAPLLISCDKKGDLDPLENTPPVISLSMPADNATNVENLEKITISFSKKIVNSESNLKGISLAELLPNSQLIAVNGSKYSKSISEDGLSASIIIPEYLLSSGSTYHAIFSDITAFDGTIMKSARIRFTTKDVPFAVVSISPKSGAVDVALDAKVIVVFNKRLNFDLGPGFTINPHCDQPWTTSFDNDKTLTMECKTLLTPGSVYDFIRIGDTFSITGDKIISPPSYSFTTKK